MFDDLSPEEIALLKELADKGAPVSEARLSADALRHLAMRRYIKRLSGFSIITPDGRRALQALDRGHWQRAERLLLAAALLRPFRLLALDEPEQRLDPDRLGLVLGLLRDRAEQGTAILLISEDLDEVMDLSDRIHAIVGGRLSPAVARDRVDRQRLGLMMAGEWENAGAV